MNCRRIMAVAALACVALAGCASTPAGEEPADLNDPLEPVNRVMFDISLGVDKAVVRPVAVAYRGVMPMLVREAIRNFLNNLDSVAIFANDMLQGETERAGTTVVRAIVNTSFGVAGFFDVATSWGYARHDEDFGQTLAVWGVGEGPYLVFPLIGPANPRDLVGRGVDFLFDPLSFVDWGPNTYIPYVRVGLDLIDLRARNIETLDDIERTSVDFYASARSLYRQTRENQINNGVAEIEELPDF